MVRPVRPQRLHQRRCHVFLPYYVGERLRAVTAVQSGGHASRIAGSGDILLSREHGFHAAEPRTPRAPARAHLPLLPSGPGGVQQDDATRGVWPQAYRASGTSVTETRRPLTLHCWHGSKSFRRFTVGVVSPVTSVTEDSPSGLGRTLGKRVGGNPSRVRIPYPPHPRPDSKPSRRARGVHATFPPARRACDVSRGRAASRRGCRGARCRTAPTRQGHLHGALGRGIPDQH